MKFEAIGSHLSHLSQQELSEGGYTVRVVYEPEDICPNCGDVCVGKVSLRVSSANRQFCDEVCYLRWVDKESNANET